MPEDIKNETAQTTVENTPADVDSHADADSNETKTDTENVNDADFSDGGADASDAKEDKPDEEKPKPKDTTNSENARRRREAERKAELEKAKQEARNAAIIETLGGKNPYTGEPMKDSADVREFLTMREIENKGGDPLTDYAKHVKAKEKEAALSEEKQAEERKWYRDDRDAFAKAHPEVKISELISDPNFQKFAEGKVGRVPLSKIYESFIDFVGEYEKKAEAKAKQILANKKSSPGALSRANPNDNGYFTREQVRAMSQEDVHKNYDKIRASMSKWK